MVVAAVYDANVLYPSTLRDVLIRVGLARLVRPRWTAEILDETFRNLEANRPDLDPSRLARTRSLMEQSIRDVEVTGYEHLIDGFDLPDPDDRHVLAAAIRAEARIIVTKNLADFPAAVLESHGVRAEHPEVLLSRLARAHPHVLANVIEAITATRRASGATTDIVLDQLAVEVPVTAQVIRSHLTATPSDD
jgi:predicted nucleic acid-binding protein